MDAIADLYSLWDDVVERWMAGDEPVTEEIRPWFDAYSGSGRGAVDSHALPEPYLGRIEDAYAVFLSLNPGDVRPLFQSRNGLFANEIRTLGSYREWAFSWPYFRDDPPTIRGGTTFHTKSLRFLRDWYHAPQLSQHHMASFDLYPWHSTVLTSRISLNPDALDILTKYVWEPIAQAKVPFVFAFGRDWFEPIQQLGYPILARLGLEGDDTPFDVSTRTVLVVNPPWQGLIIAGKTHNYPAPPATDDVDVLIESLLTRGVLDVDPRHILSGERPRNM